MRDLFDKEFQQEMDEFFDFIDHEVLGKPREDEVVTEPVQNVVETEAELSVKKWNALLEREDLEMRAELAFGI